MYKEKYEKTNFITEQLLVNFFNNINKTYKPIRREVKTILEVGCGHGYSTQELCKIFGHSMAEASDIDENLVYDAKKLNPTVNITTESIYNLNRSDRSFDLVVLLEVLEHLSTPDLALREIHRVSKKYCMISVPNEPLWRVLNMMRGAYLKEFGNTPGHINHWSKKGITRMAKNYFDIVTVVNSIPWTILLVKK